MTCVGARRRIAEGEATRAGRRADAPKRSLASARGHSPLRRFREAYAEQRAAEGRGDGGEAELLALPYISRGPRAAQWRIRARTFDRFVRSVLAPLARRRAPRPLRVLDLGAGNGWLCHRVARHGHRAAAVDLRDDEVDGLGAAVGYSAHLGARMFDRIAASFEALPLADDSFDVVVFNASLHYALDLRTALAEAARVVAPGGRVAILDSPFYRSNDAGDAMVAEKRERAADRFGERADALTALSFIEYLTPASLAEASAGLDLEWRRHRVRYPLGYELRPLIARLRGRRRPSRFDVWEAAVPRRPDDGASSRSDHEGGRPTP